MWLSLRVGAIAALLSVILGLWLGRLLAAERCRGKRFLEAVIELPLVLPPTVLGYYLLVALGQSSPLGRLHETLTGRRLLFTWQAAVLAAVISATPLMIRSVRDALAGLDPRFGLAARGLGASSWRIFCRVSLPLARGPVLGAAVLAFARSMADFGVTLLIAGNLPNRTQTLSVAVFDAVQRGDGPAARALVLVMSVIVAGLLFLSNRLQFGRAVR